MVVVLVAALLTACQPTAPGSTPPENSMAAQIVQSLNAERTSRGLAPLRWDQQLTQLAYDWSRWMAWTNSLTHRNLGALFQDPAFDGWSSLGENIYTGSPAAAITGPGVNAAFMNSAPHRANILNPGFDAVGVGVVIYNNSVWVTENFGRSR